MKQTAKILAAITILSSPLLHAHGALDDAPKVTYSNKIAGLLKQNCISCHTTDGVGGFSLETYKDAKLSSTDILEQCAAHKMPHGATARPECSPPGTFFGPSRLTQLQINDLRQWVEQGAPAGDLGHIQLPEVKKIANLDREPDLILENDANGFEIPAGNQDGPSVRNIIRNFPIRFPLKNDYYIVGVKIIPDGGTLDPKVDMNRLIHHAHLFYDESAKTVSLLNNYRDKHPEDKQPGFTGDEGLPKVVLGPWFPGQDGATFYPDGVGVQAKVGSNLVLQVHYALYNSEPYVDRTKVAIWLAHRPVHKQRMSAIIKNEHFTIPANDEKFAVDTSKTFDKAFTVYSLLPHMHQIGRDFQVTAKVPNSADSQCMLDVEWDFNHQNQFHYQKPRSFPAGTTIQAHATFNNTESNPSQFNHPVQDVLWGENADQEMMLVMVAYSLDDQYLNPKAPTITHFKKRNGSLIVEGSGMSTGAWIEINGKFIMDSEVVKTTSGVQIQSSALWKRRDENRNYQHVTISVVNPDGGRSNEITIN